MAAPSSPEPRKAPIEAVRHLWSDEHALADRREFIALRLMQLAGVVAAGFCVYQLLLGQPLLFALMTTVAVFMWANVYWLGTRGQPLVPYLLLTLLMSAVVCLGTWYQGTSAAFWAFPVLFGAYFLLPRRQATLVGAALTVTLALMAGIRLGWPTGVRAFAAMGLTLFMISWALGIIAELQRALREQAITDPLTGAFNRRHLEAELARLSLPADGSAHTHSLLAFDIDHFKLVNDRHGHAVGDQVLRQLVAVVSARKRASDLLFRTGGEEFVLLLYRTTSAQAQAIAEDLRQRLESQGWLPDGDSVTISIGVNTWRPGQSIDEWMLGADRALYAAKREGRNRVTVAGELD